MKALKDKYPIKHLCEAVGISRASYYKWLKRKPSKGEHRLKQLKKAISEVYHHHKGIYGYRRITIYLNHYKKMKVNHKCVYRLMRLMGLKAIIRRRKYNYRPSKPIHIHENLLNRKFTANKAYQKLLTDVTEFQLTNGQKAYLSAVLDLGTNRIVAYELGHSNNNPLVLNTFKQIESKLIAGETMIHSDRGYQYTSHAFAQFIKDHQAIQSMSRVGKCIDNGPMESFFGILKSELYYLNKYDTFENLKNDIDQYIRFFNTKRITLKMGLAIPAIE